MISKPIKQVVVVGAGPAGMLAALAAAQRGATVSVCEKLDHPGVKLLATGGGRCNLTNTLPAEQFMAAFGRSGRFIQPALAALDATALRGLLDSLGVPTVCGDGFNVYPASNKAITVQSALWRRCRESDVALQFATQVTALRVAEGRVAGLETSAGPLEADAVVLAAGGRSYPALGGSTSGYELAASVGHTLVPPTPALVPLVTRRRWPGRLAGLSLAGRVRIDLPGRPRGGIVGDILFTHHGLSGPAVLDLSGDVAALLTAGKPVPLRVNFAPDTTAEDWLARMEQWRAARGAKRVVNLLAEALPASLAEALCGEAGISRGVTASQLPAAKRRALAGMIAAAPLEIVRTEGWDKAMVTRGGVSLKEVDPRTLASRVVGGLHLAGEMLDLDGPSGGFNLQWAFSSGHLAGASAAAY